MKIELQITAPQPSRTKGVAMRHTLIALVAPAAVSVTLAGCVLLAPSLPAAELPAAPTPTLAAQEPPQEPVVVEPETAEDRYLAAAATWVSGNRL